MHDQWNPYFTVPDVQHALCNAHHLSELEALTESEGEAWAHPMQRSLRMAGETAWIAREESVVLPPGLMAWFEQRYDRLVAEALEYHEGLEPLRPEGTKGRKKRRRGHNLALRDRPTMKLCMKISGAFRSERRKWISRRCATCCRRHGSRVGMAPRR